LNKKKASIPESDKAAGDAAKPEIASVYQSIKSFLKDFVSIKEGTDYVTYIEELRGSIYLRGANVWFLLCSTVLACIGLDLNSSAVIIGAMLISPLMYPILGIGISVGINDEKDALLSIREFTITVLLGLITATIYFSLSPLGLPTTEILARTNPNLLDVGVAVFGGIAGIIANTRKKLSSAIPGVAIATALIPPLCVAGFGIAKGMWEIFFGAFYLLLINSVFISAAAYAVIKLLKFPLRKHLEPEKERKRKILYYAFLIIVILPSIYIFYGIIVEAKLKNEINSFLNENLNKGNTQVLDWRMQKKGDTLNELKIYVVGDKISKAKKDSLQSILPSYGLEEYKLDIRDMGASADLKSDITKEIMKTIEQENQIDERDVEIERLNNIIASSNTDSLKINNILIDIRTFNPEILKMGYSVIDHKEIINPDSVTITPMPTLLVEWDNRLGNSQRLEKESRIYDFLLKEFNIDTLQIVRYR
jgi:uncharacterized hydrophobic protein (TIGR00271 family)